MVEKPRGSYAAALNLLPGRYRFRYLAEDGQWFNDESAHAYEGNEHGGRDSVPIWRRRRRPSPRKRLPARRPRRSAWPRYSWVGEVPPGERAAARGRHPPGSRAGWVSSTVRP